MNLKETLREEFEMISGHFENEDLILVLDFLDQAYDRIETETAKAFGGCTNCYGKGYATVRETAGTSKKVWLLDPIVPCDKCDRGQQIAEMHDRIREESLRELETELERIAEIPTNLMDLEEGQVKALYLWAVKEAIQSLITKK